MINIKDHDIIVFTGPESTGKSTLALHLSRKYNLPLVKEYARSYLEYKPKNYVYTILDLEKIALTQNKLEADAHQAHKHIICDTDLLTLELWSLEKYSMSLDIPIPYLSKKHYILCTPDIPWQADPLRENPYDRDRLFSQYESYLKNINASFQILDRSKIY